MATTKIEVADQKMTSLDKDLVGETRILATGKVEETAEYHSSLKSKGRGLQPYLPECTQSHLKSTAMWMNSMVQDIESHKDQLKIPQQFQIPGMI